MFSLHRVKVKEQITKHNLYFFLGLNNDKITYGLNINKEVSVLVNLASVSLMIARNGNYKSALVLQQPHPRICKLNCSLKVSAIFKLLKHRKSVYGIGQIEKQCIPFPRN
jgi:hypothetical protein